MPRVKRSVVDSDVWIRILRRDTDAIEFVKELAQRHRVICSVITIAELYAGVRPGEEERMYWMLRNATHAQVTTEIAQRAGFFRRRYLATHGVELTDCLIAATAEAYHADLVTYNTRHFPMPEIRVVRPK